MSCPIPSTNTELGILIQFVSYNKCIWTDSLQVYKAIYLAFFFFFCKTLEFVFGFLYKDKFSEKQTQRSSVEGSLTWGLHLRSTRDKVASERSEGHFAEGAEGGQ